MNAADRKAAADGVAGSAGMNQGMQVLSYLIAGIALYGGLGWGLDHVLHTRFLLPVGLVLGAALAMYVVIKRLAADPAAAAGDDPAQGSTEKGRS